MNTHQILQALLYNHQIEPVSALDAQQLTLKEHQSLAQLQCKPSGFLNQYDQLFRYVALWLLQRGYALTDHQPHQSLLCINQQWACEQQINNVIKRRHQLKKRLNLQPPSLAEENTLRALLVQLQQQTSQAC